MGREKGRRKRKGDAPSPHEYDYKTAMEKAARMQEVVNRYTEGRMKTVVGTTVAAPVPPQQYTSVWATSSAQQVQTVGGFGTLTTSLPKKGTCLCGHKGEEHSTPLTVIVGFSTDSVDLMCECCDCRQFYNREVRGKQPTPERSPSRPTRRSKN